MGLSPEEAESSSSKTQVEDGLQVARCYAIIDIGHQPKLFKGQPAIDMEGNLLPPSREVALCFELTKYMNVYKDGEAPVPKSIIQKFTFSNGAKAKLPDVLKSWGKLKSRLDRLDLKPYLGQFAILNVEVSKDGKHANIASGGRAINPMSKEFAVPKIHYPKLWFEIENFTWDIFNSFHPYVQKLIKNSREWSSIIKIHGEQVISSDFQESQEYPFKEDVIDLDQPQFS